MEFLINTNIKDERDIEIVSIDSIPVTGIRSIE